MFRRNNLNIGIGLGILVPAAVFGILSGLANWTNLPFKTRTLALIAICLNMLLMRAFKSKRANESIRGTVLATVVMALIWFGWFYNEISAEW